MVGADRAWDCAIASGVDSSCGEVRSAGKVGSRGRHTASYPQLAARNRPSLHPGPKPLAALPADSTRDRQSSWRRPAGTVESRAHRSVSLSSGIPSQGSIRESARAGFLLGDFASILGSVFSVWCQLHHVGMCPASSQVRGVPSYPATQPCGNPPIAIALDPSDINRCHPRRQARSVPHAARAVMMSRL